MHAFLRGYLVSFILFPLTPCPAWQVFVDKIVEVSAYLFILSTSQFIHVELQSTFTSLDFSNMHLNMPVSTSM
jgi:hypothetical protein